MSDDARVLFTARDIRLRVRALGRQISRDYAGREPVLISPLKGGVVFLSDLVRSIDLRMRTDFMSISPYAEDGGTGTGVVRIEKDLDADIADEDVIIVEDIIDTGLTLSYLISTLRRREPRSVEICTLLDKRARRIAPLDIKYVGFECPDRFVVGYGLDHRERYRNLPYILAVENRAILAEEGDGLAPSVAAADAAGSEGSVAGVPAPH
jgi:hypoxanthine phosphoribosyltransferase